MRFRHKTLTGVGALGLLAGSLGTAHPLVR